MNSPFRQGLRVQGRVLYALILREALTRYGKSHLGYLWALLEPALQILLLVWIFSQWGRAAPVGNDLALFFVTGIVPWFIYSNMSNRLSGALGANQALMSYPQVTPFDVLMARAVLEWFTLLSVAIILLACLLMSGRVVTFYDPFQSLMALLVLAAFSWGIGMINAVIRLYFDGWDKLFSTLNRPLYFLSGIFFTASSLPYSVQRWLQWNPIFQFVEWFRSGFYATYERMPIRYSFALGCALVAYFLGCGLMYWQRHRARSL
jgi:capsular polysaccharide transport system permease protein